MGRATTWAEAGASPPGVRSSRDAGLEVHVRDVVNVLEYEALCQVTLVGNSSGGMVITGVADRMPERIARVVYLDAFVPEDGRRATNAMPRQPPGGNAGQSASVIAKSLFER
jgi:pimeloyl-ACP methyl ester carboxylesterase